MNVRIHNNYRVSTSKELKIVNENYPKIHIGSIDIPDVGLHGFGTKTYSEIF